MATINIPSLPGPNTKLSPLVVEKIAEAKEAIREAHKEVREMHQGGAHAK